MMPPGLSPALIVFCALHIAASDQGILSAGAAALPHYDVSCDDDEYWSIYNGNLLRFNCKYEHGCRGACNYEELVQAAAGYDRPHGFIC